MKRASWTFLVLLFIFALSLPQTTPTLEEMKALKAIRGKIPGIIIWSTLRHGTWQIYRMNADGTDSARLTNDDEECHHPIWSRDGQWIYYQREEDIYRMRSDGTDSQLVVKNAMSFDLVSGGQKLVYVKKEQDAHTIMLHDLEAKSYQELLPRLLPKFEGKELMHPTLSPDGQWLAYASEFPNPWTVHMVKMDGSGYFQFARGCQPQYSPDGTRVVWIASGTHDVSIAKSDGRDKRPLSGPIAGRPFSYYPRWSPDGQYVVFAASPHQMPRTGDYEIYITSLGEGKTVRLTFHPSSDIWPDIFIPRKNVSLKRASRHSQ